MINYIIFGMIIIAAIPLGFYMYRRSKKRDKIQDEPYLEDASSQTD